MHTELQRKDYRYYICDFSSAMSLGELPWRNDEFDVFILNFDVPIASINACKLIIENLVSRNTDWFHTLGIQAEQLHDEIDLAGVRLGRQKAVGDGSPMTGWFEEITTTKEMAEHIDYTSLNCDNRVVVVLGTTDDFNRFVDAMKTLIKNDK
jgi:hypothetical protein